MDGRRDNSCTHLLFRHHRNELKPRRAPDPGADGSGSGKLESNAAVPQTAALNSVSLLPRSAGRAVLTEENLIHRRGFRAVKTSRRGRPHDTAAPQE